VPLVHHHRCILIQDRDLLNIKNGQEIQHGCQQSCCWSERWISNSYNGEKTHFPTYIDRLSQIDFNLLADLHYGSLPIPDGIKLPKLTNDILSCLQNNTVISADATNLESFLKIFIKKIG
jgi:hypothetical protein